jgi:hypothetical protein
LRRPGSENFRSGLRLFFLFGPLPLSAPFFSALADFDEALRLKPDDSAAG